MLWMLGFIIIRFRFIVGVGLMVGLLGRLIIRRLWFMINWLIGWFWVMVARLVVGFRRFVVTCLVVRFGWGITISTCTINGFGVVASAQVLIESCSMRTMESLLATIFVAEMVNLKGMKKQISLGTVKIFFLVKIGGKSQYQFTSNN